MKRKLGSRILTGMALLLVTVFCRAQEIKTEKTFWGTKYTQEGKRMSLKALTAAVESDKDAFRLMQKARTNNNIAMVLGGTGGFLLGYHLTKGLIQEDPNWSLVGIGAGLVAISIPISHGVHKDVKKAIESYNDSLKSGYFQPEFRFIGQANQLGVVMNF